MTWSDLTAVWGNGLKEDKSGHGKSGYKAIAKVFHASDDNMPGWYENSGDRNGPIWDEFEDKIEIAVSLVWKLREWGVEDESQGFGVSNWTGGKYWKRGRFVGSGVIGK